MTRDEIAIIAGLLESYRRHVLFDKILSGEEERRVFNLATKVGEIIHKALKATKPQMW